MRGIIHKAIFIWNFDKEEKWLNEMAGNTESPKYIDFLEATGAEHIGSFTRWAFFRRKSADGEFELFSDNESRIKYFSRVIRLIKKRKK